MNWIYSLAQPFVWHPTRAAFVAFGWLLLAFAFPRAARRPLLVVTIGWSVFALLEVEAWRERADIRVDLLFTWPALCVLTIVSLAVSLKRVMRSRKSADPQAD